MDGQLAVAAVDEHGQLDARGPAEVDQLVQGRAHRAAREEHVVHEHHRAPVDGGRNVGALEDGLRPDGGEVVAVEGDVEGAHRRLHPPRLAQARGQAAREGYAARAHAHEHGAADVRVPLQDLVRHAREGA